MTWLNTWWKHGLYMAGMTLVMNLITRAIWWSDRPLFSLNVPLALAIGFAVGCAMWPIQRRFLKAHAEFEAMEAETNRFVAELESRLVQRYQAMGQIEEFLKHPETGVERERPKRRTES